MRCAAFLAVGALALLSLLATPASADCMNHPGFVDLEVCDDENGNSLPDELHASSDVFGADYEEADCFGCGHKTEVDLWAEEGDAEVAAHVECKGAPTVAEPDCKELEADADHDKNGVGLTVKPNGLTIKPCVKLKNQMVTWNQCVSTPVIHGP